MIKEFKEFVLRGNVVDLAVGVIVGGAFGNIVSSLVNDILMPIIGVIIGGIDFSNLVLVIGNAKISYGSFIQNVVDFLIVAFCIFIFVKAINKLTHIRKKEEKKEEQTISESEIDILKDIREELKNQKHNQLKTKKVSNKK